MLSLTCAFAQTRGELRSRAFKEFESGRFTEAEQILRALLEQMPNDTKSLEMLAAVLDSEEKFDEAERCYDQALRNAPHSVALLNDLGNHFVRRNEPEQARAAFLKVLAINPEHENANLQLARIAANRRQGVEALRRLEHIKQKGPAIELLRAEALYWAGRHQPALALVSRVEAGDEDAAIDFSAGTTLARMEQYGRAEAAFTRALEKAPADFDVLLNLGHAAALAGHRDRAERALGAALKERPDDVDALCELGRLRLSNDSYVDAIALLGQAAKRAPQRADVLLELARAFEGAGYFGDAVVAYDRYLALRPADVEILRDRAFASGRSGQLDTGTTGLKSYLAKRPNDATAHFELGVLYARADTNLALAEASKSLALAPNDPAAHYLRGVVLHHSGQLAQALAELQFVVARRPDDVVALDQLAEIYLALHRPEDAEPVLRHALSLAPDDSTVLLHLGRTLAELGRGEEAEPLLRKSQAVRGDKPQPRPDPGVFQFLMLSAPEQQARRIANLQAANRAKSDPELKLQLGQVLLAAGKVEEAQGVFRELLAMRPDAGKAVQAGKTLLRYRQYDLAAAFLKISAGVDTSSRLSLAAALLFSTGPQEALAELASVPEDARTPDYYLLDAEVLDSLGRGDEAADALNRGLRSASSPPDVVARAAQLLVRNGRGADALALLNRTLAAQPEQPDTLLAKAMVLQDIGSNRQAEQLLTRIEDRWPEWGRPFLVHGLLLRKQSREAEAKKLLDIAGALGEKPDEQASAVQPEVR